MLELTARLAHGNIDPAIVVPQPGEVEYSIASGVQSKPEQEHEPGA
jgi:hypothetical protein